MSLLIPAKTILFPFFLNLETDFFQIRHIALTLLDALKPLKLLEIFKNKMY